MHHAVSVRQVAGQLLNAASPACTLRSPLLVLAPAALQLFSRLTLCLLPSFCGSEGSLSFTFRTHSPHPPLPRPQVIAGMIRHLLDAYNKPVPAILEIPSKVGCRGSSWMWAMPGWAGSVCCWQADQALLGSGCCARVRPDSCYVCCRPAGRAIRP